MDVGNNFCSESRLEGGIGCEDLDGPDKGGSDGLVSTEEELRRKTIGRAKFSRSKAYSLEYVRKQRN
jgi:hypothetical protein